MSQDVKTDVLDNVEVDVSLDFRFSIALDDYKSRLASNPFELKFAIAKPGMVPETDIEIVPSVNFIVANSDDTFSIAVFDLRGKEYMDDYYVGQTLTGVLTPHLKSRFAIPMSKEEAKAIREGKEDAWAANVDTEEYLGVSIQNTHSRLLDSFKDPNGGNGLSVILNNRPRDTVLLAESHDGITAVFSVVYFLDEETAADIRSAMLTQVKDIMNSDMVPANHIANAIRNVTFELITDEETTLNYRTVLDRMPSMVGISTEQIETLPCEDEVSSEE